MSPPKEDPEALKNGIISQLENIVNKKGTKVAVHCMAGVGRAGTIVCCLLLSLKVVGDPSEAILSLRSRRHYNCVETQKQRDYVCKFAELVTGQKHTLILKGTGRKEVRRASHIPKENDKKHERGSKRRLTRQDEHNQELSKTEILAKKKELHDRFRFKNLFTIDKVFSRFHISSAQEAKDLNLLEKKNIKYVLITAKNLTKRFPNKIKYGQIQIQDLRKVDLLYYLPSSFEYLEEFYFENQGNILVHCHAGASRSVSVTTAYLMIKLGITLDKAFNLVKSGRKQASPNFGFMEKLSVFEEQVMPKYYELVGEAVQIGEAIEEARMEKKLDIDALKKVIDDLS